ncbi:MAG: hypothetical protein ACE5JI_02625 [Acidobacteriota bacterium]
MRLQREARSVVRYQAVLRMRGRGPEGRFQATQVLVFERPDRVRLELLGAFGSTRWVAVASGGEITVVFPGRREFLREARVEEVVRVLLGIPLSAEEVMAVLAGTGLPLEHYRPVDASREGSVLRIHLQLKGAFSPRAVAESTEREPWGWGPKAVMEGAFSPRPPAAGSVSTGGLRPSEERGRWWRKVAESTEREPWGWGPKALMDSPVVVLEDSQVLEASHGEYRVVYPTAWKKSGRQVPHRIEIRSDQIHATLNIDDLDVNVRLHPDAFALELPDGASRLRLTEIGDEAVFVRTDR